MTRKRLILMLVAAGLVVAAACIVFSLYPGNWLDKDSPSGPATLPMAVPAPMSAPTSPAPPAPR